MLHLIHMHRGEAMRKLKSIKKQKGKKKVYHVERNNRLFFLFRLNEDVGIKTSTSKEDWLIHNSTTETVTSTDH